MVKKKKHMFSTYFVVKKKHGFLLRCSPRRPNLQAQADGALQSNAVDGSDVGSLLERSGDHLSENQKT